MSTPAPKSRIEAIFNDVRLDLHKIYDSAALTVSNHQTSHAAVLTVQAMVDLLSHGVLAIRPRSEAVVEGKTLRRCLNNVRYRGVNYEVLSVAANDDRLLLNLANAHHVTLTKVQWNAAAMNGDLLTEE